MSSIVWTTHCFRRVDETSARLDVFARDWTSIVTPEGKELWIQLKTGKAQYSSPFVSEFADAKNADSYAYWGDVNEAGNDQVRQEVLDFVCPTHQPEQLRNSLTKTVPKARTIPNKVVMQTKGDQYERWKQATSKELQAFLKTAWKEPTAETKARYFAKKQKVVMQLLVFTMKPMTAEKRALRLQGDEYEKARICLQGQNHEGFRFITAPRMLMLTFIVCSCLSMRAARMSLRALMLVTHFSMQSCRKRRRSSRNRLPNLYNLVWSSLELCINVPRLAMVLERHPNFGRNHGTRH